LISLHAVATLVMSESEVGSFILVAEVNLMETGLQIVGDKITGFTKVTYLESKIDCLTMGNCGNAREGVGCDIEAGHAG